MHTNSTVEYSDDDSDNKPVFLDPRHTETIEGSKTVAQSWRMKERVRHLFHWINVLMWKALIPWDGLI